MAKNSHIAILMVNGGNDPPFGSWIDLGIRKIFEHSGNTNFIVHVWNNGPRSLNRLITQFPPGRIRVTHPSPGQRLSHPHASALQCLWEAVRAENPTYVIFLDSDAHPIRNNWLKILLDRLDNETVMAGVWRDELSGGINPYLHASCLATTPKTIVAADCALDYFPGRDDGKPSDTLSFFTDFALRNHKLICKLRRTNRFNFHRLVGGLYGDLIYHHGAGSRNRISFWDETSIEQILQNNCKIVEGSAKLLFNDYNAYISLLRTGRTRNPIVRFQAWKLARLSQKNQVMNALATSKKSAATPNI